MTVFIFIVVLAVLILVHELGHFLAAKKSGVDVPEFGIGFPPKLLKLFKWRGTEFTLNLLPFGGFVRILGENPSEKESNGEEKSRNFSYKPRRIQAIILAAGVFFNLLFAWILISFGFMVGLPAPLDPASPHEVLNARLTIVQVLPDSPADQSELKAGDIILKINSDDRQLENLSPEAVSDFIAEAEVPLTFEISRGEEIILKEIKPEAGIVEGKKAVGISMNLIGTLKLLPHLALLEGGKTTLSLTGAVALGLLEFIGQAITGQADFSQVAGPVGIIGLVGDATRLGFIYLIQFTAFISINLAVINLFPFPALDGGRLLFVLVEAIRNKSISPKIVNVLNGLGFMLLILLIILVTISDVVKLF